MDTTIDIQQGDQANQELYGVYYDDIARIDSEWKFTHRLCVPIYISSGCVTGDVVTPRSRLLRGVSSSRPDLADSVIAPSGLPTRVERRK
jgi:hypothetical protein